MSVEEDILALAAKIGALGTRTMPSARLIALPERWYGSVVDEIAIVEDHDPGDEDAGSASMRRISQYARRADAL